jgi:antitoxin component of MazEF toxin-antitoxin module
MIKKLVQHGNSSALIIDKPILEMLKISNKTLFEISTDGKNLILSPKSLENEDTDILKSLQNINKKYSRVFKKLADAD